MTIIFLVNFTPCFPLLPADLQIQLTDNQNHIYTNIPVIIDSPNIAYVTGDFVQALDPSLQYSFILNYSHTPIALRSINDWINDQSYIVSLRNQGLGKKSSLVQKEIIQQYPDLNSSKTSVTVYPNPTQGKININASEPIIIYIYNMLGEEIMHQTCSGNCSIKLPAIDNGLYAMKIYDSQNRLIDTKKVSLIKYDT